MEELNEIKNGAVGEKTRLDMYSSAPNREDETTLTATEDVEIIPGSWQPKKADVENSLNDHKERHYDAKKPDRDGKQELVTTDQGNLKKYAHPHKYMHTCIVRKFCPVDPHLGNKIIYLIKTIN